MPARFAHRRGDCRANRRGADGGEPVAPSMERLREAVADGRMLPYATRAFDGWPRRPPLASDRTALNRAGYVPDRIYARSGGSAPSAIAAPVTGSGGEYGTSRGFISQDDAILVAAALAGNAAVFDDVAAQTRVQMLYGLSLPHLVIWSANHDALRDPQLPLAGDRPYRNEGGDWAAGDNYGNEGKWCAPADYPRLAALPATAGVCYAHTRDQAHLFNHGYAYWLATGDPRAALLQQAIQAYSLAANWLRWPDRYRPRFAFQRVTVNQFNAAWVARDVALNASGPLLWDAARAGRQVDDVWAGWQTMLAAMDAAADVHSRSSSIVRAVDLNADNAYNAYQVHGYGIEAAYLWALAGRPALLHRIAEHLVLRFGTIGGTLGYYGRGSGSGMTILSGGAMPYSDAAGFAAWTAATAKYPADTFDGAPAHYVLRAYWGLKMAADAVARGRMQPVDGLDAAIARMEAARAATTRWANVATIRWKHAGVAFE